MSKIENLINYVDIEPEINNEMPVEIEIFTFVDPEMTLEQLSAAADAEGMPVKKPKNMHQKPENKIDYVDIEP